MVRKRSQSDPGKCDSPQTGKDIKLNINPATSATMNKFLLPVREKIQNSCDAMSELGNSSSSGWKTEDREKEAGISVRDDSCNGKPNSKRNASQAPEKKYSGENDVKCITFAIPGMLYHIEPDTLSCLGEKIGSGSDGIIHDMKDDPKTVLKLFFNSAQDFMIETRIYLFTRALGEQTLKQNSVNLPKYRGIYYLSKSLMNTRTPSEKAEVHDYGAPYPYGLAIEKLNNAQSLVVKVADKRTTHDELLELENIMCNQLEKLHDMGIVHGDPLLANIMCSGDLGKTYFVDFARGALRMDWRGNEREWERMCDRDFCILRWSFQEEGHRVLCEGNEECKEKW